jgi:hypothetical protein
MVNFGSHMNLYIIRLRWTHEPKIVEGCVLIQAASPDTALETTRHLVPTRISEGEDIAILSEAIKVPENCGEEPVMPKLIAHVGASS